MTSVMIDFVLSMLLFFLILSLAASGLNEAIARVFALRSRHLWRYLRRALDGTEPPRIRDSRPLKELGADSPLSENMFDHPMVRQLDGWLGKKRTRLAQIPSSEFSRALIDLLSPEGDSPATVESVRNGVLELPSDLPIRRSMLALIDEAEGSVAALRVNVSEWFDASMDSLSRRYRLHVKWVMFAIGLLMALVLNASTLRAADEFYRNDVLRTAVAGEAVKVSDACSTAQDQLGCTRERVDELDDSLEIPIGWKDSDDPWWILLAGWLLTAAAVSQGAQFWFDLLGRASRFRTSRQT